MSRERTPPPLTQLPRLVFGRSEALPAASLARAHSHPFGQLSYAGEGVIEVTTPVSSHVAPPRRAVWVPPGLLHEVTTTRPAAMRSLYIRADQTIFCPPRCLVLRVTSLARELILAAAALPPDYDEAGPAGRLAQVLLDQLAALPEADLSLPWPADPALAALCRELRDAPDDGRDMDALARQAGMSGRTLARRFEAQTGLRFGVWRRRQRLLAALGRLEAGDNVTAAALESGYASVSAFVAAFREMFGATPAAFTRRNGKQAGGLAAATAPSRRASRPGGRLPTPDREAGD